jgi:hypothetical protein
VLLIFIVTGQNTRQTVLFISLQQQLALYYLSYHFPHRLLVVVLTWPLNEAPGVERLPVILVIAMPLLLVVVIDRRRIATRRAEQNRSAWATLRWRWSGCGAASAEPPVGGGYVPSHGPAIRTQKRSGAEADDMDAACGCARCTHAAGAGLGRLQMNNKNKCWCVADWTLGEP